jgi:hypothetical protein
MKLGRGTPVKGKGAEIEGVQHGFAVHEDQKYLNPQTQSQIMGLRAQRVYVASGVFRRVGPWPTLRHSPRGRGQKITYRRNSAELAPNPWLLAFSREFRANAAAG